MRAGRNDRSKGDRQGENVAILPSGYIAPAAGASGVATESLITSANVFSASATAPPPMPSCVWDEAFDVSSDRGDPDERNDDSNGNKAVTGGSASSIPPRHAVHRGNLFLEADPDLQPMHSPESGRGPDTDAPHGRPATAAAQRSDATKFVRPAASTIRRLVRIQQHPRLFAAALLGPLLLALASLGMTQIRSGGTGIRHREGLTAAATGRHQAQGFAPNRWPGAVDAAVALRGYRIASRPRPRQVRSGRRRRPRSSVVTVAYAPTHNVPASQTPASYTSPAAPQAPPPSYSPSRGFSSPSSPNQSGGSQSDRASSSSAQPAGPAGPGGTVGGNCNPKCS